MNGLAYSSRGVAPRAPGALRHAVLAWDGILELLPIAVYVCDGSGMIIQYNRRAAELWGRTPEVGENGDRFCGSYRLYFNGQLTARDETPMAHVLRTGEPVHGAEGLVERPDGSHIWAMVHIDPLHDEHGNLIGAINCFHDTTEQKRSEEKLREQEQRLAVTYNHATIGISEIDAEGRWLRMNDTACRIAGGTREELLGQSTFAESEREANEPDWAQFQRLVAGEVDQYTAEHRHRKRNGERIWVGVMCSAVRDKDGKFLYAVRVVDDITESKQMADALAESQMRLAATYEQATIGISEADAEGRLLRVNEASCTLTGFSREELLARPPFFTRMRAEDVDAERDLYRRQVAGEIDRYTIDKRIRRKDEREIFVSVMSSSVRDRDGKFRYAVRVLQDITERKRAEDRLRASERRLRELLEGLPAAIYTTDAEGRITFFNQAAVEFSGRVPVLGSDEWCVSWRLFWPDGRPMPHDECPMAVTLREGRAIRDTEAVAERPDGTRVPFIPYPTPLFGENGEVVGAINMLVDISDRKKSELHLRTLVDELNHRVKNTLATVQSLARQSARSASTIKEFQARLQGRLIALSEGHDQLTRGNWEQADLREVIDAALKPYRDESGERIAVAGGRIKLHPRAALTLSMVFHELITNAAKYGALSSPNGRLSISWERTADSGAPVLALCWREEGGPKVEPPRRRGFGTQMVERSIPAELGGRASLHFEPEGLTCELQFPIASYGESASATSERTARIRR